MSKQRPRKESDEEKILRRTGISLLILLTAIGEFVLTLTLIILNGIPAILKGYWSFFWVFFITWGIASFVWISVMAIFIDTKKRKKLLKEAGKEFWRR